MGIKGAALKGCSLNVTNEKLETIEDYVKMVSRGYVQCLFLFGEGGIGKTETIMRTLEGEKADAVYLNGVVTPLELYNLLYEYNGKLVVLDDIEGVLNNARAISFLKGATYGYKGKRMVCYPTNTPLLRAPESFEFTGQLILCMNKFPENAALESLYKRTVHYELKLSLAEKKSLLYQISEFPHKGIKHSQRKMVCEFLVSHLTEATKDVSLRDLFKSYEIYRYKRSEWKPLVLKLLKIDTDIDVYLKCAELGGSIKAQIRMFAEITGKSRRTFFYIRKKVELI